VQIFAAFLLLFDFDCPKAFDSLCLVCAWGVIVAFMRIGLGNTKSEEGHGKELEGVLEGGAVGNLW